MMSILSKNTEPFCIKRCVRTDDRQSGYTNVWTESEAFDACAVQRKDSENQHNTEAQKPEAKRVYDLFTTRSAPLLSFHCIVKRNRDGKLFRIISDSADLQTPRGSLLDLRLYTAEEWRIT